MTYCVNPDCPVPENLDSAEVCASCGSSLLLNQRYQPIRVLGQGGFGATFIARNLSLPGTPVCAVKQLRIASANPQAIERARQLFEREATTLGKIGNHPQVPSLLDYFEDDCQFYLVQEYVKGWTLKQEVKRSGPFDEAKIRAFLLETLTLLKYFQYQEVIHRDIKPANIIRRSIDGHLVFIDFGAVKDEVSQTMLLSDENNPNTAFAIGTPGFAPPEQLGLHPTYASDIYALGATCLYLMTGQSPKRFGCDLRTGAINWHGQISLSEGLTAILDKMLQPQTALRYSAAALVINDLQRLNAQVVAPASPTPLTSTPAPERNIPARPTQASSAPPLAVSSPTPPSLAAQSPTRSTAANPG
ncbi:MAG: serine/threonine protein kinase, partial [Oscillatoriales cyanobacterium]